MFELDGIFCNDNGVNKLLIRKKIKNCPGIAIQCRGQVVYVEPHPKLKGSWRFELNGETWFSSDWAFEEGY